MKPFLNCWQVTALQLKYTSLHSLTPLKFTIILAGFYPGAQELKVNLTTNKWSRNPSREILRHTKDGLGYYQTKLTESDLLLIGILKIDAQKDSYNRYNSGGWTLNVVHYCTKLLPHLTVSSILDKTY